MEICKKKIINIFLLFIVTSSAYSNESFQQLENKKVSYIDFFLLKFENTINKRAKILSRQAIATRVQYSNIGIQVDFDKKNEKIYINIYAIMDKYRYSKKNIDKN